MANGLVSALERLPPELFAHILSFLPLATLPSLQRVSKHFFLLTVPTIYRLSCSVRSFEDDLNDQLAGSDKVDEWLAALSKLRNLARDCLTTKVSEEFIIDEEVEGCLQVRFGRLVYGVRLPSPEEEAGSRSIGMYTVDLESIKREKEPLEIVSTSGEGVTWPTVVLDHRTVAVASPKGVRLWVAEEGFTEEFEMIESGEEEVKELQSLEDSLAVVIASVGGTRVVVVNWQSGKRLASILLEKAIDQNPSVVFLRQDLLFTRHSCSETDPYDQQAWYHLLKRTSHGDTLVERTDIKPSLDECAHWMAPMARYLPQIRDLPLKRGSTIVRGGILNDYWLESELELSFEEQVKMGSYVYNNMDTILRQFSNFSGQRQLVSTLHGFPEGRYFMWESSSRIVREHFDVRHVVPSDVELFSARRHRPLPPVSLNENREVNALDLHPAKEEPRVQRAIQLLAEVKDETMLKILRKSEYVVLEERGRWMAAAASSGGVHLWKLGRDTT